MKKAKKFFYLFFFIIFVVYLYSQEKCYPKFGDIFGLSNLPLQTYGFFIAMAFLFGAIFLKDELNRLYKLLCNYLLSYFFHMNILQKNHLGKVRPHVEFKSLNFLFSTKILFIESVFNFFPKSKYLFIF